MASRSIIIAVFVIPIVFSFIYGGSVLSLALIDPTHHTMSKSKQNVDSIMIIGLRDDYTAPENISAQVSANDPAFNCGDLYLTIYEISVLEKKPVGQNAFFDQCYGSSGTIPLNEEFSEKIDKPGKYSIVAQLFDKDGNKFLTTERQFTVK